MTRTHSAPFPRAFRRHRAGILLALTATAGIVLAGCAPTGATTDDEGGAAAVFDKFNAMSGQERHDALVEAAQEEGGLVFYTASAGMQPVVDAFSDEYGIEVELYTGQSESVFQRIVQEADAGLNSVDVYDDGDAYLLKDLGLAYPYVNDELTADIPNYLPDTLVTPTRLSVYTIGWNTSIIDESELPDSLEGFTDPKWKGRLALDPRNWDWYSGIVDYYTGEKGWSDEQVDDMIKTIASYSTFYERANLHAQLMLTGEIPVSLSVYVQSVDRELEKDASAPIARLKSDGTAVAPYIVTEQGSALLKNAPHPASAMLFIDFMLTDGQGILAGTDRTPTAIAQPGGPLEDVDPADLHPIDKNKVIKDQDTWETRWNDLIDFNG